MCINCAINSGQIPVSTRYRKTSKEYWISAVDNYGAIKDKAAILTEIDDQILPEDRLKQDEEYFIAGIDSSFYISHILESR